MRLSWDSTVLDGILTKALMCPQEVECATHQGANKLRYALINRVRRRREESPDFTRVPFGIAVKGRTVQVQLAQNSEILQIRSITEATEGDEDGEEGDTGREPVHISRASEEDRRREP